MDPVRHGVVQVERADDRRRRRPKVTSMDNDDLDLASRLAALEARAPADATPPVLPNRRRRGRFAVPIAMAPVLVLAIVATTAAGAIVVSGLVKGYPGIQNPGQPLAGAHMECMSPPEAAAFLASHGFADVDWQVEGGDPNLKINGQDGTTTVHRAVPPEHGYVVPGSLLDDGSVIMVVDQRVGATGVGDCYGHPMP
jgi:hypothetical protein